nr:hypothetical protein Iba_chr04dCG8480 [Ipomoea batatas]
MLAIPAFTSLLTSEPISDKDALREKSLSFHPLLVLLNESRDLGSRTRPNTRSIKMCRKHKTLLTLIRGWTTSRSLPPRIAVSPFHCSSSEMLDDAFFKFSIA